MKTFTLFLLTFALLSSSLYAQNKPERETKISEQLRQMVVDGSRQMYEIATSIKTLKDAEAAKPKIRKMKSDMVALFEKLSMDLRTVTLKKMYDLRMMGRILEDPELKAWREKAEAALFQLEERDPEVAAVMWEAGSDYDNQLMETMMKLVVGYDQLVFNDSIPPIYTQSQLVSEYRDGLIVYCQNLTKIMAKIKTVKDAQRAESALEDEAEALEDILWGVLDKADGLSASEKRTIGKGLQQVLSDSEVVSCSGEATKAHEALGKRSAKALEEFDAINREESEEFEDMSEELIEFLVEVGESQE